MTDDEYEDEWRKLLKTRSVWIKISLGSVWSADGPDGPWRCVKPYDPYEHFDPIAPDVSELERLYRL